MKVNSMSYDWVFDSYAWIEYFRGSRKGERVRKYVEDGRGVTPMIVIAELSAKYSMENWDFREGPLHFSSARTTDMRQYSILRRGWATPERP